MKDYISEADKLSLIKQLVGREFPQLVALSVDVEELVKFVLEQSRILDNCEQLPG